MTVFTAQLHPVTVIALLATLVLIFAFQTENIFMPCCMCFVMWFIICGIIAAMSSRICLRCTTISLITADKATTIGQWDTSVVFGHNDKSEGPSTSACLQNRS